MERKDLTDKIDRLLIMLRADMENEIRKVLASGCVSVESEENDYRLPKAILCAVLKYEVGNFAPLTASDNREVDNIYLFT